MIGHMPGPWRAGDNWIHRVSDNEPIGYAARGSRKETHPDDPTFTRTVETWTLETALANARLMAAAPALLDALRAFCGDHEATGFECAGLNTAYQHAKAVIADVESDS